ncbi:hypothetical protein N9A35_00185 [bacterium]|nr:hypothetical protein [bacterium]
MELPVVNHPDYVAKINDDNKFPIKKFGVLAEHLLKTGIVEKFYIPKECSIETMKTSHSLEFNNLIVPFIFLFIAEIFPLKSTGSFFTTGNTTYIFLIMAILIGLVSKKNSIENKT